MIELVAVSARAQTDSPGGVSSIRIEDRSRRIASLLVGGAVRWLPTPPGRRQNNRMRPYIVRLKLTGRFVAAAQPHTTCGLQPSFPAGDPCVVSSAERRRRRAAPDQRHDWLAGCGPAAADLLRQQRRPVAAIARGYANGGRGCDAGLRRHRHTGGRRPNPGDDPQGELHD